MSIDWGDAPAWAAISVTFVFSLTALVVALKTYRLQKESTKAAKEQAKAAQDAHELSASQIKEQKEAEEAAARRVTWAVEPVQNALYRLRNTSKAPAMNVTLDRELTSGIIQNAPENKTIDARGSVEFYIIDVDQEPFPGEIWLTWDGQPEPVAVPVPQ